MHRNRAALAVLLVAGLVASGCGSDDDPEPKSDGKPARAQPEKSEPKKPTGVRAQMVKCIETELGFDVSPDDDPDTLAVDDPDGKLQAEVVIHNDAGAARKAVAKTLNKGSNAVTFGRAEFIRRAADDTEAGVIANCVALAYNRPASG